MILGYESGSGFLYRAHPFTVLTLVLATLVTVFALPALVGPLGVLVGIVLLAFIGGVSKVLPTASVLAAPFWFFLVVIHVILGDAPTRALVVGLQVSSMIVAFLIFLVVTHPGRLVDAMLARRLPAGAAYLLASALQTVPRLRARAAAIRDAQLVRGLRVQGVGGRVQGLLALGMPLVLGALHEVDERSLALASRGVQTGLHPTPLHPPSDSSLDRLARLLLYVFIVAAVAVRFLT